MIGEEERELEDQEPEDAQLEDDAVFDPEFDDEDLAGDLEEDVEVIDRSAPVLEPTPGCAVSFFLDNKLHHGVCLAVIGEELLIEHRGATKCVLFLGKVTQLIPRLRLGIASATFVVGQLKPCKYRSVPKRWLWKLVTTGQTWKGIERGGGLAPTPNELLKGNDQMELF